MRWLLAVMLVACAGPRLEDLGRVNDAGSCQVLVAPGDCSDAPGLERQREAGLPCNTCVVYQCECSRRLFCKVCTPGAERSEDAWACTPTAAAWCGDLP